MAEKDWKKTLIFFALGASMATGGPPMVTHARTPSYSSEIIDDIILTSPRALLDKSLKQLNLDSACLI